MKYTYKTLKYIHAQTQQLEPVIKAAQHIGTLDSLTPRERRRVVQIGGWLHRPGIGYIECEFVHIGAVHDSVH